MEKKYFGTDGIRGRVGEAPITADFMLKLGWAVGRVFEREGHNMVLIGKDTRISGYMFESALEAGLSAAGVDIHLLGPMPTPGIAYLTRTLNAKAGIVISASHNPYTDNGIKFFTNKGTKLPNDVELAIEAELEKPMQTVDSARLGKAQRVRDAAGRYIEFCKSTIPATMNFSGLKIVVDCAHGATYHIAPSVLKELGAEVITVGTDPDGLNINTEVGSTHPATLQKVVLEHRADLGIALDGDGDRLIMVDHKGDIVDGDEILYIIACSRHKANRLNGVVVGTLMTNLGLEHALKDMDVKLVRANVGDRYVLEQLHATGGVLGGETSGHIICLDRTTTGDGMVSALQVLAAMAEESKPLHDLKSGMIKYPQHMVNVHLERKVDVMNSSVVQKAVEAAEKELADKGRIVLRPSGTEPLVRVMVEGADGDQVVRITDQLAAVVKDAIKAA